MSSSMCEKYFPIVHKSVKKPTDKVLGILQIIK